MADVLTHVFLPLTAVYVLRQDLFDSPAYLAVGGFGLVADFDKFLGMPGLLHSLVTLVPLCGVVLAVGRWRDRRDLAWVIIAVILSHLVLDIVDGGPVPLLYPFLDAGIGLQYPAQTAFGQGPLGVAIDGPLVSTRMKQPRPGFNTYGFIQSGGVAGLLLFAVVYVGLEWQDTEA